MLCTETVVLVPCCRVRHQHSIEGRMDALCRELGVRGRADAVVAASMEPDRA